MPHTITPCLSTILHVIYKIGKIEYSLPAEKPATHSKGHTGDHVILNQPSQWGAIFRHQIVAIGTG